MTFYVLLLFCLLRLSRSVIDIDILSMVSFMGFPPSPEYDMCHEMYFMCLHNGTVYINFSTRELFRPLRCLCVREMLKQICFGNYFLFYDNHLLRHELLAWLNLEMILRNVFVAIDNNEVINSNICSGKLTIFRSHVLCSCVWDVQSSPSENWSYFGLNIITQQDVCGSAHHKYPKFICEIEKHVQTVPTHGTTNIVVYWKLSPFKRIRICFHPNLICIKLWSENFMFPTKHLFDSLRTTEKSNSTVNGVRLSFLCYRKHLLLDFRWLIFQNEVWALGMIGFWEIGRKIVN